MYRLNSDTVIDARDPRVAFRCPSDFDPLMRQSGGQWEPGGQCWLIERRRLGPLVRNPRRVTDPLFCRAGLNLDEG